MHDQSTKFSEQILKAARGKDQVTYKGRPIRVTPNFSVETLRATRASMNVMQDLKAQRYQTRLLYLENFSTTIDGERKHFIIKPNLRNMYLLARLFRRHH